MSLNFFATALTLFSCSVVTLAATSESKPLSAPQMQYRAATTAQKTVATLTSKMISADLKKTLLEKVRPEDKEYAKNLVVHWKPMNSSQVTNEFDSMVVRDANGIETLRMRMLPETPDTFVINGRKWQVPTSGSLEKSLRRHLANAESAQTRPKKDSIFAQILSPAVAFAADEALNDPTASDALKVGYLYHTTLGDRDSYRDLYSPSSYASEVSGNSIVHNRDGILGYVSIKMKVDPAVVTCEGTTAKGKATFDGERMSFISQGDGTVILTLEDAAKTRLQLSSDTVDRSEKARRNLAKLKKFRDGGGKDFQASKELLDEARWDRNKNVDARRALQYADQALPSAAAPAMSALVHLEDFFKSQLKIEINDTFRIGKCSDTACTKVEADTVGASIRPWLNPKKRPPAQQYALKWKPSDSTDPVAKLEESPVNSGYFKIVNEGSLSGRDLKAARKVIKDAEDSIAREKSSHAELLALRPVGACCGISECREALLEKKVNLVPKAGSGATTN